MDHTARLERLRKELDTALLVSRPANLRYLLGFTGSNGYLLVVPDGPTVFVTDGRYGEAAEPLTADVGAALEVYTSGLWEVLRRLTDGLESVALEADGVTWSFAGDFGRETGVEPVAGGGAVERLRRIKDRAEVDALSEAAAAGDHAFAALPDLVEPGITEVALGWRLIDAMRSRGADAAGWDPIVATGPGASVPHHRSGRRPVGDGLLLLDYGCVVDGYHSDMSRTVWLSGTPDPEMARVHEAVLAAQERAIAAVGPGVACHDVDETAREVLRTRGYEDRFLHSTGHGVGLEIHEPPWVRRGNDDLLRAGDVITVEPGVYLPGVGGVRIEDMVVVTEDGSRVLTHSPKGLEP
jgi:Xaa-Pro aminopeptidase